MRIGIDACDLATGIVGVGSVIHNLLGYLQAHDNENQYFLYQNEAQDYCQGPNFHKHVARLGLYQFWKEQVYFSARSYLDKLDVFHAPIHLPPFEAPAATKIIFSVHDLHSELDGRLYPAVMNRYFIPHRKKAMQKADAVIVHSEFVKKQVLEYAGISPEKVHLIPLGVKTDFCREIPAEEKEEVKKRYSLPERFILYVGSVEPWKRLPFLIESFRRYKEKHPARLSLIIVGRPGWNQQECRMVEAAADANPDIRWLGYVNQSALPAIYQLATLFCSASQAEGFGLIFLEAMRSGLPVLAADQTAIPEILGDAGLIFERDSHDDFVAKLSQLLQDKELYERLRRNGQTRAADFSWDTFGKRVHDLYRQVTSK